MDGAVRKLTYSFDAANRPTEFTSSDANGQPVNDVLRQYDGFGLLTAVFQDHAGLVDVNSSPVVRYGYDDAGSGAVTGRLLTLVYPDGRVLHYLYDNSTLDHTIGRLDGLADDNGAGGVGQHLEDLSYLGLNTIVERSHPEAGVKLTYVRQAGDALAGNDGGDQYSGLDRFGRVVDQNWVTTGGGTRIASSTAMTPTGTCFTRAT